ncbi:MAG: rod shape-determining protein MreD [Intestinibacillus sp.]
MQRERIPALKIVIYAALLVLLFLLETANGMPVRVFGIRADVLPCVMAAVALTDGPVEGCIIGILTGVLYDAGFAGAEGLYPLYFMLFGTAAGFFSQRYLRRIFPSMLLLTASAMLLLDLLRYGFSLLTGKNGPFLLFFQAACGETLIAAAFSPVVYLIVRAVSRRFEWMTK